MALKKLLILTEVVHFWLSWLFLNNCLDFNCETEVIVTNIWFYTGIISIPVNNLNKDHMGHSPENTIEQIPNKHKGKN